MCEGRLIATVTCQPAIEGGGSDLKAVKRLRLMMVMMRMMEGWVEIESDRRQRWFPLVTWKGNGRRISYQGTKRTVSLTLKQ